ncbi:MAG: TetR family transcriptional regulator [Polyangiales bacterium]
MVGRRARREDDKNERREGMLDAAAALLASRQWAAFSMSDLAARTGLSKGTLFLYYPTREALLLALFEREIGAWFDALDASLARGGRWGNARVARAFVECFEGRAVLLRLLGQLEGVLERNVGEEEARAYKLRLGARMAAAGASLERRCGWMRPGDGVRALLRARALVSGLWQMADASPVIDKLLREPALQGLRVDFAAELDASLTALLAGMELARG